jgi:GTP-binding protein
VEPNPIDDTLMEAGRKTFAGPISFLKSVVALEGLPPAVAPEVTFVGRSNVGKSSLLNAIAGRNGLARTSNTPGRTQELNFFDVGDPTSPTLRLVDLPGYGYAQVSRGKVNAWTRLLIDYMRGRAVLARAFVLIDARHGPKPIDQEMMKLLDKAAVSYQLILTKADKLKPTELQTILTATQALARKHVAAHPDVLITSAEIGTGITELRATILSLVSQA